jgi:hypothetical protein
MFPLLEPIVLSPSNTNTLLPLLLSDVTEECSGEYRKSCRGRLRSVAVTRVMVSHLISMCVGLLLLASSVSAQEVVFSRRVYAKAGHTYQQLWIWSASDGSLTPLTDSPRDHSTPVCSRDGQEVFYVSNSLTLGSSVWRVDRGTGVEQQVRRIANINSLTLIGIGQNDELLIQGDVGIALPFAGLDVDQHRPAVDILDLQAPHLRIKPRHTVRLSECFGDPAGDSVDLHLFLSLPRSASPPRRPSA